MENLINDELEPSFLMNLAVRLNLKMNLKSHLRNLIMNLTMNNLLILELNLYFSSNNNKSLIVCVNHALLGFFLCYL